MDAVHMLAIVTSVLIFLFIIELIRRGRLKERYALLWLFSSALMLGLSLWRNALENISRFAGIYYPPSMLFLLAFLFLLLINLHFSVAPDFRQFFRKDILTFCNSMIFYQ